MTLEKKARAPRPRIPWLLLAACALACVAGLGLEFAAPPAERFWLAEQRGVFALIGAGAAIVAVVLSRVLRLLLARRQTQLQTSASGDAGDHA